MSLTITTVSASATSNDVGLGRTITFALSPSQPVVVSSTPYLTLNNNEIAGYTGIDQNGRLLFSYTVAAGQDISDLKVTGISLNGGLILTSSYTYVGSWEVDQGPYWPTVPVAYSGISAAAYLFGGSPLQYEISTVDSNVSDVNQEAWISEYAYEYYGPVPQNYVVSTNGLYSVPGDTSTYVEDHAIGPAYTNYAFERYPLNTAGLTSLPGSDTGIQVDATPPAVPAAPTIIQESNGYATTGLLTISGTAEDGSTVTVFDGTTELTTTTAGQSGSYRVTLTTPLADGTHSIDVTATDSAGNVSATSAATPVTVIVTPAAPTITQENAAGYANTGDLTITGATLSGSTVTIFDGSTELATTTAGTNGAYSVTLTTPLADGMHSIDVTVTAPGGQPSAASPATQVVVDTVAPAIPAAPSITQENMAGYAGTGDLTIIGTAEDDSTVTVFDGTNPLTTTMADSTGSYNVTLTTPLADGPHDIDVTAADAAGNVSAASAATPVVVDTAVPAQPGAPSIAQENAAGYANTGTLTISGTAENNSTVTILDGTTPLITTTAGPAGAYSVTLVTPLTDGTHNIDVTATNVVGNVSSPSAATSVVVDTIPPATPAAPTIVQENAAGYINTGKPLISGTAENNSTVTVFNGMTVLGTTIADKNGAYTVVPATSLPDGSYTIDVTATDAAGNVSTASAATPVVIDTQAPAMPAAPSITQENVAGYANTGTLTISGTVENNSTVTIFDGTTPLTTTTAGPTGAYSVTLSTPLADGTHAIDVTATDAAGNISTASAAKSVIVDTVAPAKPPAPSITQENAAGYANTGTLTVSGTAENGSTITVFDGTTLLITTTAGTTGVYSVTLNAPLTDGLHSIDVTATDAAGNVSTRSAVAPVRIDTVTPAVSGVTAVPSATVLPGQTVVITVQFTDGVTVAGGMPTLTLSDGGTASYSPTATAALKDASKLVFDYPVSFNETSSPSLTVTALALNGAVIANLAGTVADVSGAMQSLGVAVDTNLSWLSPSSGNWDVAANWSGGVVPGSSNAVVIGGTAATYITVSGSNSASSLAVSDPNAFLSLTGTLAIATGLTLNGLLVTAGGSTLQAPSGVTIDPSGELIARNNTTITGNVIDNSTAGTLFPYGAGIDVQGNLQIVGSLTGSGLTEIAGGAELEVDSAASQAIIFNTNGYGGALLRLDDPVDFTGTITGVTAGFLPGTTGQTDYGIYDHIVDEIDLGNITATAVTYNNGTLVVDTTTSPPLSFAVTGSVAGALQDAALTFGTDGGNGTAIEWVVGLTDVWTENGTNDWATPADWSLGFAPGTFDIASISTTGTATITIASGEFEQAASLTLAGPTDTLVIAGGLSLLTSPLLSGGTIALTDGFLSAYDGLTLDDATVTAADGSIETSTEPDGVPAGSPGYAGATLTFGPNLTFTQLEGSTNIVSLGAEESFTNDGVIDAAIAGGTLYIGLADLPENDSSSYTHITNNDTIAIANGETLNGVNAASYLNFDNAATGTLTIVSGASATLGGYAWSNEGTIVVGAESSLTLEGNFAPASLTGITYAGGTLVLEGIPFEAGTLTATGGLLVIDTSYGGEVYDANYAGPNSIDPGYGQTYSNATLSIDAGATLELGGSPTLVAQFIGEPDIWGGAITSGEINFNGSGATLKLDDPHDFQGFLDGLTLGDQIDFAGETVTTAVFDGNALTITTNTGTTASFGVGTSFWADEVSLGSDGSGGTVLTLHPDVTPPAVTAVTASSDTGATDLDAGHVVTITLDLREAVTLTGSPVLTLNDGATATYQTGAGTDVLTFATTIQAGQNTPDLTITGLDTSNGTIQDLAGNLLASVPATDLGVQVDTTAPVLTSVTTLPAEGVLNPGQSVRISLHFSKPVSVSGGTPDLVLANGGIATFNAAATAALNDPTQLLFTYTVQPIDASTGADTITAYQPNGAVVTDAAGNVADPTTAAPRALNFGVDTSTQTAAAGDVYFIGATPTGSQVFVFNGTTTAQLQPVGVAYSQPSNLVVVVGTTYFTATYQSANSSDPLNGQSLTWSTDGTSSGTMPLSPSTAVPVATLGSTLITEVRSVYSDPYNAFDSSTNVSLLATDSSGTQTTLQNWYQPNVGPLTLSSFVTAGSTLYFLAPDTSDLYTTVLWQTDGTQGGTYEPLIPLPDGGYFNPSSSYGTENFADLTAIGDTLVFLLEGALY